MIVQAPSDPTTTEFLSGPTVPDEDTADVVSLFSNAYSSSPWMV